jgi:hypothetical protein
MMGGDGTNTSGELTELHLSAICEAMNQMMGSAATSISSMLEKRVNISPPTSAIVDLDENVSGENIADFLKGSFVRVSFHMEIGDLVDSVLMQLYPFDFARDLYQQFIQATSMEPDIPTRPSTIIHLRRHRHLRLRLHLHLNRHQCRSRLIIPMEIWVIRVSPECRSRCHI